MMNEGSAFLQILLGENLKKSRVSYSFCILKNFRRIATV